MKIASFYPTTLIVLLLLAAAFSIPHSLASAFATGISFSTIGGTYSQDFNTLVSTGTSSVVPAGWAFSESDTSANAFYTAGNGSGATGDTYSFGAAGNTDRAFGTLQTGSLLSTIGACFVNNTGKPITKLAVQYTGEMWRFISNSARLDRLDFQISTNATSLTNGTWTDVDTLDFVTPNTSGSTGQRDGNNDSFRTVITSEITSVVILPGETFFIRWLDFNASGSDDGLAVDNFSITPFTSPILTISDASSSEGTGNASNLVFDVELSEFFSETVTVDFATMNGSATTPADYLTTNGTLTFSPAEGILKKQIVVPVSSDCLIEGDESFTVKLSNAVNGAILRATGTGQIHNDDLPGVLQFSSPTFTVNEAGGMATITVTRTGGVGESVSVNYAASNGTAETPLDYANTTGTLTFGCNEVIKTFGIPIINDTLPEIGNETLNVQLNIPTNGATLGGITFVTLTIIDDDGIGTGDPGEPMPAASAVSDQKMGSVLIFPLYSSNITRPALENTRINITNADTSRSIAVHLFFVESSGDAADTYVCLTQNQTVSLLASDLDPGETGYLVAVATDRLTGLPINFNFLLGDEFVKLASGHAANLSATAFAALPTLDVEFDAEEQTAEINFDGRNYNRAPRVLATSLPSSAEGNQTLLVINRTGGDLRTRPSTAGSIFGILFDDLENPHSFEFSVSRQLRRVLSDSFPRTTPRLSTVIPAGHSGWMKFYTESDNGLVGAILNYNPNAASAPSAYNQGRSLHTLTLATTDRFVVPVFSSACDER